MLTKTSEKAFHNLNYIFLVLPIVLGTLIATIGIITPEFEATAQVSNPESSFTIPLNTTITVSTDRVSYNSGDTITISGKSSIYISGAQVTIVIENPAGNVAFYTKVMLRTDHTFSTTLTTADILWRGGDTFTVYAQIETPKIAATTYFNVNSNGNTMNPNGNTIYPNDNMSNVSSAVPEFGSLAIMITSVSMIGVILVQKRMRF